MNKNIEVNKATVAAACNFDCVKRGETLSRKFLNGAAIYAGYAASVYADTKIISCVGDEPENKIIIEKAKQYRENKIPKFTIIPIKDGRSFRQIFQERNGNIEVIYKDYGNYNDWAPNVQKFKTDVLLLGTGNPVFQKAVLDSCLRAKHILLDSKLIHLMIREKKVHEIIKRVDTYFGTKDEIIQLLKNCKLPTNITTSLFEKYPNLKVIIEKNAEKGGRVFLKNGTFYTYQPEEQCFERCSDGAGDVFAGTYAALLANNIDIKEIIKLSAERAANSVKYFGIDKVKNGLSMDTPCRIRIEESRWKNRDGRDEKNPDRGNK